MEAQGYAKALEAIYEDAKNIDDKTMALQYLDTLRTVGASASTKFVFPMELMGLVERFSGMMRETNTSLTKDGKSG